MRNSERGGAPEDPNEHWGSKSSQDHYAAHRNSDLDFDRSAQHHTIGIGPTQAAPGTLVAEVSGLTAAVEAVNTSIDTINTSLEEIAVILDALPTTYSAIDHQHGIEHWYKRNTSTTAVTAAGSTDLGDCAVDVDVIGPDDIFLVMGMFDATKNGTDNVQIQGRLNVDGVEITSPVCPIRYSSGTAGSGLNGWRGMNSQNWIVTGLDAGTTVFKLVCLLASASNWSMQGQSTITVLRLTRTIDEA